MNKGDFFKGVVQWELTSEEFNFKGKLPVFYYDNTAMTAIYTASTTMVRRLLPRHDMHPVEVKRGRALVAFTAFEYRDSDIDPYNEFSISFPITFQKKYTRADCPFHDGPEIFHRIRVAAPGYHRARPHRLCGDVRLSQVPR